MRSWLHIGGAVAGVLFLLSLGIPLPESASPGTAVVSVRVTDAMGTVLREVRPDGRGRLVRLGQVDAAAVDALLATEDRRFYRHPGIDPIAIARAAWGNLTAGRVVSGASTLTMQVARILRGRTDRGLVDKLLEMHLALRLELRWSKARILETWLNRVSFGNRAHGIEAAARLYFAKGAADLTRAEAAFLVGLPQSPSRYNPFRHLEAARARQAHVLAAMERAGHLTPDARAHLQSLPLDLQPPNAAFRAPHFTRWVLDAIGAAQAQADPVEEVRTTLKPRLQEAVAALAAGHVRRLQSETVTNAAVVVLDNETGGVLAYVGSADFWSDRTGGQNDGVRMLRQPGSTLKPFTYAHALASGRYTTASILPDVEIQVPEAGGAFSPTNYDERFHGPTPLRTALASSYNVPAVRLAREMGPPALLERLHNAGFASLDRPASHYGVGLTLGNGEVQLLELARAYAGLARGGSLPPVRAVRWMRTAAGDTLRPATRPAQPMSLSPEVTALITDVLSDPEARAPAFGRGGPLELPFPTAAKTGTSKDYRDNWTVGYTPRHTVAVWVGNFDGTPMRRVSGVTGAAPLFQAVMQTLGPGGRFERPPALRSVRVCPNSGLRPGAHCPAPRPEPMLPGTAPTDTCRVHRRIAIDTRTGLLAGAETPERAVAHRLYTVYPEVYHPWMREHDVPLPPTVTQAAVTASAQDNGRVTTDRLQIQYPADGTQYVTDPVLRTGHQRVHLRGAAPAAWGDVHWTVDGTRLGGDYRTARWPLVPGTHTLELRAVRPDGTPVRSRPATVFVQDVPREPAWHAQGAVALEGGGIR